jgi:Arc/MetJ family transcription regulator
MRTNIVIDDKLMRDALRETGLKTKEKPLNWVCGLYSA